MSRPPRPTSSSRSRCSGGVFDWEPALRQLDELNARAEDPSLWEKPEEAQALMRDRNRLAAQGDEASLEEARAELKRLKERAARAELEAPLSGEADGNDAYVEINSGAGGTESQDWAEMLERMYTRWANAHGMTVEFVEETAG